MSASSIGASPPETVETLLLAQRKAVHEYRLRLSVAARRRWNENTTLSVTDVLQWIATTDTPCCCSPSGIEIVAESPPDLATSAASPTGPSPPQTPVTAADEPLGLQQRNPAPRRRTMPPPPPMPRAQWNQGTSLTTTTGHGPAVATRSIATDTADEAQTSTVDLGGGGGSSPMRGSRSAQVPRKTRGDVRSVSPGAGHHTTHGVGAPGTPPEDATSENLRRRVVALCTENAELERKCERLKTQLTSAHEKLAATGMSPDIESLSGSPPPPSATELQPAGAVTARPSNGAQGAFVVSGASALPQSNGAPRLRLSGNAKARMMQSLRELRSKLAVVRTGVKALGASDLFHNAMTLLEPFLQRHAASARRMHERAEFFERTAQGMQAKLLSLPDSDSPEGYEVQLSPDGRSSALHLDTKTWVEFTQAFTGTVDTKFTKVEDFSNRGARSLLRSAHAEKEMKRSVADLEMRCGDLEGIAVDWECLSVAIASDAVFESVVVQPCKKMEFTALQKQLSDSNDEVRVVCGVAGWFAKSSTRAKATVWRDKRADTINRVEQLLSQELQHFMMNGAQRNSLRRKVLLLRELAGLLQRLRTDSDPLPAAAAIIASNNALPAGLALATPPTQAISSPTTMGHSNQPAPSQPSAPGGTPTRPGGRQQRGTELQVAGVRGDRRNRGGPANGQAVRGQLPQVRDSSGDGGDNASLSGSRGDGVALPAVGTPGPRPVRGGGGGGNGGRESQQQQR